jgi:homocysteine S-methyltransferase
VLLESAAGRETLARYYRRYLDIAAASPGAGFVLESPTWLAGRDWCRKLGLDEAAMRRLIAEGVALMNTLRDAYAGAIDGAIVVSGCIGPRGDGYQPGQAMSGEDAMQAHLPQARALAAAELGLPCAISFTVETDGRLPSGETLAEAIARTDEAGGMPPAYYMLNCAHPTHFEAVLARGGDWRARIRGLRANASRCSHAELDAMTTLDDGDPQDLAGHYRRLRGPLPALNVLGGCCGTDHRHVAAVSTAWRSA